MIKKVLVLIITVTAAMDWAAVGQIPDWLQSGMIAVRLVPAK